jgi:CHAD domain-containing protein
MPSDEPTAGTEREVKLVPRAGFDLESLPEILPDATLQPLPSIELRATYYDTPGLTLARAGITVRHRTGDGPPTWTVKIPAGNGHGVLVRRELNVPGARDPRPPEVRAVLTAHLRGRRLVPVAELVTLRSRMLVADGGGEAVLEISLDQVDASRGVHSLGSWTELEAEAVHPAGAADAQRRVVRALRKAGCTKAVAAPKLVRALGDAASATAEVTVEELPADPAVADVLRHALARSVVQLLTHDPAVRLGGDPEDLHQFRVAIRRLRSDLRTFRGAFDGDVTKRVRGELRWVADATNVPRDLDVLRAWLLAHADQLPVTDRAELDELVRLVDDQAAVHREVLLDVLASPRYVALLHELLGLLDTPSAPSSRQERKARARLSRQVRRRWDDLDARMEALGAEPSDLALHQARIVAKRCRAAVEAIEPITGRRATRLAKSLGSLQDVLGAAHDAAVIESWLRTASATAAPFAAGELAVLARDEGHRVAARWPEAWAKARRRHASL